MKIVKGKTLPSINESLIGGAALSLDDLARVESQEIEWLFVSRSIDKLDNDPIAS